MSGETAWEPVIGLEIHVQLNTATKMFCACENRFGAEPNTLTCPLCLGHPGVLPVINQGAVEKAIEIGLALNCAIAERSVFHRKNYFYPDSPKAYQISQYDEPICLQGHLGADGGRIGITRAHLEEDAAKLVHSGGEAGRIAQWKRLWCLLRKQGSGHEHDRCCVAEAHATVNEAGAARFRPRPSAQRRLWPRWLMP